MPAQPMTPHEVAANAGALNEADTRAKLIDPAIYQRGWTEDYIRREQTAGRDGRGVATRPAEYAPPAPDGAAAR